MNINVVRRLLVEVHNYRLSYYVGRFTVSRFLNVCTLILLSFAVNHCHLSDYCFRQPIKLF